MNRVFAFLYGAVAYLAFLAVFLYAIGFVGNFAVSTTLDGPATTPLWQALTINLGLLTMFALQHSVMARPAFRRWWTRYVPEPVEHSTHVLLSSAALIALFIFWQPMGGVIWDIQDPAGRAVLYGLFGLGWAIVLVSTFLINHFDLFGLRQVWLYLGGKDYAPSRFATPWLYEYVRHPLYLGWFLAFWATPAMTAAHLLFAVLATVYILVAVQLEQLDLIDHHGDDYIGYREREPMLIPRPGRRAARQAA